MSYFEWFEAHATKHQHLVQKLRNKNYTQEMIIRYFDFESMKVNEPHFCLLYAQNKKCHNLQSLNCYLCACPHFRFNDEGLRHEKGVCVKSECAIQSKISHYFVYENVAHLDCSACIVPHTKAFVQKHFDMSWQRIMKDCLLTSPTQLN